MMSLGWICEFRQKKAKKAEKAAARAEAKAAAKAAVQAAKEREKAAKVRAKNVKDAQENGNPATMAMFGMKHLTNCKVNIVSTHSEFATSLEELFYNAGAEHVDKKER